MTRLGHSRNSRKGLTSLTLMWVFPFPSIKAFVCKVCSLCFISVDTEIKGPHIWSHTAATTECRLYLYLLIRCFLFQDSSLWNSVCRLASLDLDTLPPQHGRYQSVCFVLLITEPRESCMLGKRSITYTACS